MSNIIGRIMEYEEGSMDPDEVVGFFEELVDTGMINHLQGHYHRTAMAMIRQGLLWQHEPNETEEQWTHESN